MQTRTDGNARRRSLRQTQTWTDSDARTRRHMHADADLDRQMQMLADADRSTQSQAGTDRRMQTQTEALGRRQMQTQTDTRRQTHAGRHTQIVCDPGGRLDCAGGRVVLQFLCPWYPHHGVRGRDETRREQSLGVCCVVLCCFNWASFLPVFCYSVIFQGWVFFFDIGGRERELVISLKCCSVNFELNVTMTLMWLLTA